VNLAIDATKVHNPHNILNFSRFLFGNYMYICYFSSWGASDEQARYLRDSLPAKFLTFTVSSLTYGGFDAASIPEDFHDYVIRITQKIVKQIVAEINALDEVVFMSHSFGYNLLFECLKHVQVNVKSIILLDPAGKALTAEALESDKATFGGFIDLCRKGSETRYAQWATYIDQSTAGLFTRKEKTTGMYRYIKDCMKNNPLDLSVFAYGGDYFDIRRVMRQHRQHIHVLTSTNGVADKSYWSSRATVHVVSRAGHFLHIYSQQKTIAAIGRLLNIRPSLVPYSTQYNAPF
jgi:hypothetical protein